MRRCALVWLAVLGCSGSNAGGGASGRGGYGAGGIAGTGGGTAGASGRGGGAGGGPGGSADLPPCMTPPGATVAGGCLQVLTSGRPSLLGPALDSANVFWTESQAGAYALMMIPKQGGTMQNVFGSASAPIAIGGSNAYLQNGNAVVAMPIAVGTQPIPFQGFSRNVAADAKAVYSVGTSLDVAPLGGGASPIFGGPRGVDVAVRDSILYWTSGTTFEGDSAYQEPAIWATASDLSASHALLGGRYVTFPQGGSPRGGAGGGGMGGGGGVGGNGGSGVTLSSPRGIAVDATYAYWSDDGTGTVARIPTSGGQATVLASGLSGPGDIAIDDVSIYFAGSDGTIKKIALAGSEPVTLVSGQESPRSVIVDATSVYWASGPSSSGSILKLTPK